MEQRYEKSRFSIRLHDVSPHTWDACAEWIDLCKLLSLPPPDLMVIPRHEGGPVSRGAGLPPEFVTRLTKLSEAGHALWIHGWTHRDHTTGGEAEFARLDAIHAADRARRSLQDWLDAGLPAPAGFCPPCWKMSTETLPLLFRLGFKQVDMRLGIARPEGLEWSPAISSWGGNGRLARLWDRTLPLQHTLLQLQPYHIRITLHPQDLDTHARHNFERILDALD